MIEFSDEKPQLTPLVIGLTRPPMMWGIPLNAFYIIVGVTLIAFLVSIAAAVVVTLVGGILAIIPCLGWIAAFVLGLAVGPYISFVTGHLYGQIAAKILGKKAGGTYSGMA